MKKHAGLTRPFDGLAQAMPDARVVAPHHLVLRAGGQLFGFFLFIRMVLASIEPAVVMGDGGADGATAFGVGKAGQGAGPGNVAVAGGVQTIPALTKTPFAAVTSLAQRKIIGGNFVLALVRESAFRRRGAGSSTQTRGHVLTIVRVFLVERGLF